MNLYFFLTFWWIFLILNTITINVFIWLIFTINRSFYLLNIWLSLFLISLLNLFFFFFFLSIGNNNCFIHFQFLFLFCFLLGSLFLLINSFLFSCFPCSYRVWTYDQFRLCIYNFDWIIKNLVKALPILRNWLLSVKINLFYTLLLLLFKLQSLKL